MLRPNPNHNVSFIYRKGGLHRSTVLPKDGSMWSFSCHSSSYCPLYFSSWLLLFPFIILWYIFPRDVFRLEMAFGVNFPSERECFSFWEIFQAFMTANQILNDPGRTSCRFDERNYSKKNEFMLGFRVRVWVLVHHKAAIWNAYPL